MKKAFILGFVLAVIPIYSCFAINNLFLYNNNCKFYTDSNVVAFINLSSQDLLFCKDRLIVIGSHKDSLIRKEYFFDKLEIDNIKCFNKATFPINIYKSSEVDNKCIEYAYYDLEIRFKDKTIISLNFSKDSFVYSNKTINLKDHLGNNILLADLIKSANKQPQKKNDQILGYFKNPEWSTFFGGMNLDLARSIRIDNDNNIIVIGTTLSNNLPTTNGAFSRNLIGNKDCFVMKMDPNGQIIWLTYLGSEDEDNSCVVAVDKKNNYWFGGETRGFKYPITKDAYQKYYSNGSSDGVIVKFDKDGKIIYSTYAGGGGYDAVADIRTNSKDEAWIVGRSYEDFPTTSNAIFRNHESNYDGFIMKIDTNKKVLFSSLWAFDNDDIIEGLSIDSKDNVYFSGYTMSSDYLISKNSEKQKVQARDAFIVKLNDSYKIEWSIIFGGSENDFGSNLTVDENDNIVLGGLTFSNDLPTNQLSFQRNLNGSVDAMIAKFNPNGKLLWTTYFGGSENEGENAINDQGGGVFAKHGKIILAGRSSSNDLTIGSDYFQNINNGGAYDAYFVVFNEDGSYNTSSYIGGNNYDFVWDFDFNNDFDFYLCGMTNSSNFPTTSNAFQKDISGDFDAFIIKFSDFVPPSDTSKPTFISDIYDCNSVIRFVFSDPNLKHVEIVKNVNCNFSSKSINDTAIEVIFYALPNESFFEFEINALDNFGNVHTIKNKIFRNSASLKFIPTSIDEKQFDFDSLAVGKSICLPIKIINQSNNDTKIDSAFLCNNTIYSFPHSQIPMIIPAKDTIDFFVCYSQTKLSKMDRDTLVIGNDCNYLRIPLMGVSIVWNMDASSKCNTKIGMKVSADLKPDRAVVVPNPSSNIIKINFNGNINSFKKVSFFNSIGQKSFEYQGDEFEFDISGLNSGLYYVCIEQNNMMFQTSFVKD